MAVSGQLCRLAEGMSYQDITLAHRHPPPSQQKSDTCANPVQKFRRAAPFLQGDILVSYKICTSWEFGVCVYYCSTHYKAVRVGGGG